MLCASRISINDSAVQELNVLLSSPLDWGKIVRLSVYHGIAPLLYQNTRRFFFLRERIPKETISILQKNYYVSASYSLRLWKAFLLIFDTLTYHNIQLIPLKGIIFGHLIYRNPALRPIPCDIDILIPEKKILEAVRLIEELGYRLQPGDLTHQKIFKRGAINLDVHWRLLTSGLDRIHLDTLWERATTYSIDNRQINVLSYEDMILTLPLQLRYGLQHIRLFRLLDIHEILRQKENALDWDYIITSAKRWRIAGPLVFCLCLCERLFSSPLPSKIIFRLTIGSFKRKLLRKILQENSLPRLFTEEMK
ncbi:MAG: nucleotidyltransferase family protein, partial [Candidatus Omnitrophica bacterium]|nr:nucleotidyltransferase family protein [Candidatus Omnitrophota bacterium]